MIFAKEKSTTHTIASVRVYPLIGQEFGMAAKKLEQSRVIRRFLPLSLFLIKATILVKFQTQTSLNSVKNGSSFTQKINSQTKFFHFCDPLLGSPFSKNSLKSDLNSMVHFYPNSPIFSIKSINLFLIKITF